jgi:DNA-3-methyladenine glycosylase I
MRDMATQTDVSAAIAKDLRARGGNFVGPTIIYAFMQATGMVNDHLVDCCRHEACRALAREFKP